MIKVGVCEGRFDAKRWLLNLQHGFLQIHYSKDWIYLCISTTQWVTGWSNGVASLDQSIAHVAFELWNDLYFRIKATPQNFRGSFILNNWKLSNNLWCQGSVVVTENSQNRSERLLQQLWVVCVFAKWCIVRWRYVS